MSAPSVEKCGDMPLTEVTRAKASDFLSGLDVSTQTRNTYALTLKRVFKCAARRGRFSKLEEDNPFHDQRLKVTKGERVPRDRFTIEELQTLFDNLPREVNPKKHTPETAVPWVALIAAYSGACLEEICQLTLDDIRKETVNGGTLAASTSKMGMTGTDSRTRRRGRACSPCIRHLSGRACSNTSPTCRDTGSCFQG
jgi:integrase